MDNTILTALLPFWSTILAAIITGAVQIVVAYITVTRRSKPSARERLSIRKILRPVKWWLTLAIVAVFAVIVTLSVFVAVNNSTHCVVTSSNWMPYNTDGSTITVKPVPDSNCAVEFSFDLAKGGWVAAYKKLTPGSLEWWIKGIEFSYSGMGNSNTIEIKLLDGSDVPYKSIRQSSSDTGGRFFTVSIPFEEFLGPDGRAFHPEDFTPDRIDFSFSNGPESVPGAGSVVVDDIRVILAWQVWLLIFAPLFGVGVLAGYLAWRKRKNPGKRQARAAGRR
jgi:hypothetical protein